MELKTMYPFKSSQRATNAIFGAVIGDAAGAATEFLSRADAQTILRVFDNYASGLIASKNLQAGQFTDDSEMGLTIMSVIIAKGAYDQEAVATEYHRWYHSHPVDIGKTIKAAVSQPDSKSMILIARSNATSLSNGFLMRLFGLVAMYYQRSIQDLTYAVRSDVVLTHGRYESQQIAIIYSLMLRQAIYGATTEQIYLWGLNNCFSSTLFTVVYDCVEHGRDRFTYDGLTYYWTEIDSKKMGFVGFSIWILLWNLRFHTDYRTAILATISLGGDTDTNACIVGAVFGAIYPLTIPATWRQSVTTCVNPDRIFQYDICNPKVWIPWTQLD